MFPRFTALGEDGLEVAFEEGAGVLEVLFGVGFGGGEALKRFVEQAEQYIDKLREITFAETVNGVDPFAQCAFPADPDRIRLFLRSNGRRRPERPIL